MAIFNNNVAPRRPLAPIGFGGHLPGGTFPGPVPRIRQIGPIRLPGTPIIRIGGPAKPNPVLSPVVNRGGPAIRNRLSF